MIPRVHCLTTKKDEQVYTKIFGHVISLARKLDLNLQLRRLTIDFEIATMNSFCCLFPTASVTGCLFHYVQSLWRKIQELDLSRHVSYSIDEETIDISSDEKKRADHWFLAAIGLVLIPPELVERTWAEVMVPSTYLQSSSMIISFLLTLTAALRVITQKYGMFTSCWSTNFHARIITLKVLNNDSNISFLCIRTSSTLSNCCARSTNTSITSLNSREFNFANERR